MKAADTPSVVTMPRLSDAMEDGTIVAWLIDDGQPVEAGQDLVEIETDKATVVYKSPSSGLLSRLISDGETAPVGAVIAELDEQPASSSPPKASPLARRRAADAGLALTGIAGTGPRGQIRRRDVESHLASATGRAMRIEVSPAARHAATRAGLDLATVTGSGPRGRIRLADVAAHIHNGERPEIDPAPAPSAPDPGSPQPRGVVGLSRRELVVARRMSLAKSTIPDFCVSVEVDMEGCRALRLSLAELGDDHPVPSYNDLVIKACAMALRGHPRVNSSYRDDAVELHSAINVGMAVAAGENLLVATIKAADQLSIAEIARETRRLVSRVRDESITPEELGGATFTVSNLGMLGVDEFTAVINPPQAAILAVGSVAPRAVVRDGELAARTTLRATLTADHRVIYGSEAAAFLASLKRSLEQPLRLLLPD